MAELLLSPRHCDIQKVRVVGKLCYLVINHAHDAGIVLTALILVDGTNGNGGQLPTECIYLMIIWRNYAYIAKVTELWQHFLAHHVYLALIIMVHGMCT